MPSSEYFELLPDDYSEQIQYRTDRSTFDSGREQRRSRWAAGKTIYSFVYPQMIDSDITTIWSYYSARKGSYESFYLAVPPPQYHDEVVWEQWTLVLSGATKPSPSNITVRKEGHLYTDWTYDEATKTITFGTEQSGFWFRVTYYEMLEVRFLNDSLSRDWLLYLITNQTLDFITV